MNGPGQMGYDYGRDDALEEPAPQEMNNFGSNIGKTESKRRAEANRRLKKGECPKCGNKTHKVDFFTRKRTPLTVEGKCIYGTCLFCHPIEGYIRPPHPQRLHPESIEVSRTRGVTPSEDEYSMVSGITMEPDLLGAPLPVHDRDPLAHMEGLAEEGSGSNNERSDSMEEQNDRRQYLANVAETRRAARVDSGSAGDYSFDDNNGVFGQHMPYDSEYLSSSAAHLPHNETGVSHRVMDPHVADSDRDLGGFEVGRFRPDYARRDALGNTEVDSSQSNYDDRVLGKIGESTADGFAVESNVETAGGAVRQSSRSLGGFQATNSRGNLTHETSSQQLSKAPSDSSKEESKTEIPAMSQDRRSKIQTPDSMSSSEIRKVEHLFHELDKPELKSWRSGSTGSGRRESVGGWSLAGSDTGMDMIIGKVRQDLSRRTDRSHPVSTPVSRTEGQMVEDSRQTRTHSDIASDKDLGLSRNSYLQSQHTDTEVATKRQEAPNSAQKSSEPKQPQISDVPIILNCMKMYPENALLHERAYDAMFVLATASDKRCKDMVVANGGVEAIVEGIWRHMEDSKVQLAGLFALWALAASDSETDTAPSNFSGVTDAILISMQTHTHEASIQQAGCGVLSCLARAAAQNHQVDDGVSSGAMYTVINAMDVHSASADMQEWGIRALYHECVGSDTNKLNLVRGDSISEVRGGGIDAIYRAIKTFQSDLAIQEWGCRLFNCLSTNEKVAAALSVTVAGIEAIVNAMAQQKKNPRAVGLREEACGALSNLAVLTEQNNALIRSTGAIKTVVGAMILYPHAENLHIEACTALANLAVAKESRISILQFAGPKIVLSSMRNLPQSALLQEEGCRLLRSMCLGDAGTKDFIAANAAVSGIIRAMTLHPESKGVQEMAAAILASLAVDESRQDQILSLGGVDAIAKAMLHHPRELSLQEVCCKALRNISSHVANDDRTISSDDVNEVVRAMIAHPDSESIQEDACCMFWNLSANSPRGQTSNHIAPGEVKYIVKAIQNHPESAGVQEVACGALWSLSTSSEDVKNTVVSEGGIDAIMCALIMYQYEIKVLEMACGVLSSLSADRRIAKSIADAGCIGAVVESMRNNVPSALLMECGSLFLRNLAAFSTNYAEEASSICSTIVRGMAEHPDDAAVQREACGALWSLAAHSATCKERILFADGVDAITRTMRESGGDAELTHEARGAMSQLV